MSSPFMIICTQCNEKNDYVNKHCWRCGRDLGGDKLGKGLKFVAEGGVQATTRAISEGMSPAFKSFMFWIGIIVGFFVISAMFMTLCSQLRIAPGFGFLAAIGVIGFLIRWSAKRKRAIKK